MDESNLEHIFGPARPETMTRRERLSAVLHFRAADRLPFCEPMGFLPETPARWVERGFPVGCPPEAFFDLDRVELVPIGLGPFPALGPSPVPVATAGDFARVCGHYSCYSVGRYPTWWEDERKAWATREYPLGLRARGPLAWLRDWCGDAAGAVLRDQPQLADEMMTFGVEFCMYTLERAAAEVDADFAVVCDRWSLAADLRTSEAIAARALSLCGQLAGFLRGHGADVVILCSDGDLTDRVPSLLDIGVNGLMPCSAAEGMDVLKLAEAYPRDLILVGGADVRALARDRRDADREARLKMPAAIERGGWVPCFDAPIGPEAKFDNYRTYWEAALEIAAGKWPPEPADTQE
jgi:hypothetical protein